LLTNCRLRDQTWSSLTGWTIVGIEYPWSSLCVPLSSQNAKLHGLVFKILDFLDPWDTDADKAKDCKTSNFADLRVALNDKAVYVQGWITKSDHIHERVKNHLYPGLGSLRATDLVLHI
jgi:hypothetical protein